MVLLGFLTSRYHPSPDRQIPPQHKQISRHPHRIPSKPYLAAIDFMPCDCDLAEWDGRDDERCEEEELDIE